MSTEDNLNFTPEEVRYLVDNKERCELCGHLMVFHDNDIYTCCAINGCECETKKTIDNWSKINAPSGRRLTDADIEKIHEEEYIEGLWTIK